MQQSNIELNIKSRNSIVSLYKLASGDKNGQNSSINNNNNYGVVELDSNQKELLQNIDEIVYMASKMSSSIDKANDYSKCIYNISLKVLIFV